MITCCKCRQRNNSNRNERESLIPQNKESYGLEEVLYERHEVEECAVIGLPDKEYGERVVAYIVPRQGQHIDPVELKAYLKIHLSPFKVPKAFIAVSDLPKSSSGKLLKRTLKEQVLNDATHRR